MRILIHGASATQKEKLRKWLNPIPRVHLFFTKPCCETAEDHLARLLDAFFPNVLIIFAEPACLQRDEALWKTVKRFRGRAKVWAVDMPENSMKRQTDLAIRSRDATKTLFHGAIAAERAALAQVQGEPETSAARQARLSRIKQRMQMDLLLPEATLNMAKLKISLKVVGRDFEAEETIADLEPQVQRMRRLMEKV